MTTAERTRVTEWFVDAAGGRLRVVAHCGAQTTRDTAALAEHAARTGAEADLREAIRTVRSSPFIPHRSHVRGFLLDLESGRLRELAG